MTSNKYLSVNFIKQGNKLHTSIILSLQHILVGNVIDTIKLDNYEKYMIFQNSFRLYATYKCFFTDNTERLITS